MMEDEIMDEMKEMKAEEEMLAGVKMKERRGDEERSEDGGRSEMKEGEGRKEVLYIRERKRH
jgi:hypothetical protein